MSEAAARQLLINCCGSSKWVELMMNGRPFPSEDHLFNKADEIWFRLTERDWLEAFSHHPKIGDISNLKSKFSHTAEWAGDEQSGTRSANEGTLIELRDLNVEYEQRHGFIFIVCATGKSATEMLSLLKNRLPNDRAVELKHAALEQAKITRLRLEKAE